MQAPHVLEQHPGLAQLLADLNTRFLTPTGLSLEHERDLNLARYSLKSKKSYLETKTIFEPLERLRFLPLDNNRESNLQGHVADTQRQISDHIDQIITLIEIRSLGLESTTSSRRHSQGSSLSRSSNSVYSDATPNRGDSRSPLSSKGPRQAASGTDNLLQLVTSQSDASQDQDLDSITMEQLQPHFDALDGFAPPMMQTIDRSIHDRAQDVTAYFEKTFASSSLFSSATPPSPSEQTLSEVNRALELKLRISASILRQSVYNKETLDALSSLRDALKKQQDALASQLQQNTELLQRYQNAGEDFNRIVHAYADVLQKIELVQDDIARLK
ncbi:hypothetical protein BGZ83_001923 [Gryganskiella cystojenkinii]|nr:hypothetical protein BGZ83_001923 [Gryganskiella cystojenkinii]